MAGDRVMRSVSWRKQKGIEPLYWTLIIVVMSLLFLTFSSPLLSRSVDEAARNNEGIIFQNIISGINIVQTSPDTTSYIIQIPGSRQKCQLEARNGLAKLTLIDGGRKSVLFSSYIASSVPVSTDTQPIDCLDGEIVITKINGAVRIA